MCLSRPWVYPVPRVRYSQIVPEGPALEEPVPAEGDSPGETNPPEGDAPAEPAQPVPTGDENVQIVYDNSSASMINISQGQITVQGVEFRRIDNQGNVTASYPAEMWGYYYGGYDPVPSNYCLRIGTPNSPHSGNCIENGNFETSQDQYYFYLEDQS